MIYIFSFVVMVSSFVFMLFSVVVMVVSVTDSTSFANNVVLFIDNDIC